MSIAVVSKDDQHVKRGRSAAKRTAVLLALLAVTFYIAIFLLMAGA